ncbi:MAG: DUF2249 domain-containing protein [Verrucomicrobia bacterium]|nr:DUF2249 domain-containing protein [Verrucomicrobiota bacterium]MDA1065455.1 DUF2249 domain-containing protein [Verrucomicrobiota bacterium]
MDTPEPLTVDVRPLCERGEAPIGTILDAVDQLMKNQKLILIAPFEPLPLYGLLALRGFTHTCRLRDDDCWEITFISGKAMI